jgi:hypothetical protein
MLHLEMVPPPPPRVRGVGAAVGGIFPIALRDSAI